MINKEISINERTANTKHRKTLKGKSQRGRRTRKRRVGGKASELPGMQTQYVSTVNRKSCFQDDGIMCAQRCCEVRQDNDENGVVGIG